MNEEVKHEWLVIDMDKMNYFLQIYFHAKNHNDNSNGVDNNMNENESYTYDILDINYTCNQGFPQTMMIEMEYVHIFKYDNHNQIIIPNVIMTNVSYTNIKYIKLNYIHYIYT
jgi:hypothetical protein